MNLDTYYDDSPRKFIDGPGIDEPIMMIDESSGSRYYYLGVYPRMFLAGNGLGSVAALSNTNGTIAEQYRYDAFGNTRVYDGSIRIKGVSQN